SPRPPARAGAMAPWRSESLVKRTQLFLAPVLFLIAVPAFGTGKSFLGQAPPSVGPKDILNPADYTDVADCQGGLLLIEFFATWCGPCRGSIAHVNSLWTKYHEKGLDVLAVSNEDKLTVERFVRQMEPRLSYPIAIGGGSDYEVRSIPHAYLIGGD